MRLDKDDDDSEVILNCLPENALNPDFTSIVSIGDNRRSTFLDAMEGSRKRTEKLSCKPIFIGKQQQEEFIKSKTELPYLKAEYSKQIKLWGIIGGMRTREQFTLSVLLHKENMSKYSQKLKVKRIGKERILMIKEERVKYLQEQIEKVKSNVEQLVEKAQNILNSELSENCICVPRKPDVADEPCVGCSGNGCKQEWFHLPCVGLIEVPTGHYYCPLCCFIKYQKQLLDLEQNEVQEPTDDIIDDIIEEFIE
jgi:hypothetical protein